MGRYRKELRELLHILNESIDPGHMAKVDERYKLSLDYKETGGPPLVAQPDFGERFEFTGIWSRFRRYPRSEAFYDPEAMMQNMLLDRVVPGVILSDDSPLAIRNDHGTIQVASILGGKWEMYEDNYPWVGHLGSEAEIEALLETDIPDDITCLGAIGISVETLELYADMLSDFPVCRKAIQISLPDLQGPLDTAEQLWGSDIYYSFYENPDLLGRLLERVTDIMLLAEKIFRRYTYDRLEPFFNTQHSYMIPGRIMIRNDSSIMISPEMYGEHISRHDKRILDELGGGTIHFCGSGQHLIKKMLEIPGLKGFDFGEPCLMDIPYIYAICREKKAAITNINPSREDIMSGKAVSDHPTGAVFVYRTGNLEDAKDVVEAYRATAGN